MSLFNSGFRSQIFMTRSWPRLSKRPRSSSKWSQTIECLASWHTARDVRLRKEKFVPIKKNSFKLPNKPILLVFGETLLAFGADADVVFESDDWQDGAARRTVMAHSPSAQATMVLTQAQLPLIEHAPQVPEKRATTSLASTRFRPFWSLYSCTFSFKWLKNQQNIFFSAAKLR